MALNDLIMLLVLSFAGFSTATISKTATDTTQYIESSVYSMYIQYARDTYTTWIITAQDSDKNVKINMDMDIENCCGCDYVKLYDGSNNGATLLGTYCGTRSGVIVASTGRSMYVVFSSDSSIQGRGFRMTYYQVDDEEEEDNRNWEVWMAVGITLTVVFVAMAIAIITCVCCMCMKHKDQVNPVVVHYHPGQRQPMVWTTMNTHSGTQTVTQTFQVVAPPPPPAYTVGRLPPAAAGPYYSLEQEKPPLE